MKLQCITLCGLANVSFDKPNYSISRSYILNIARTLLSPIELGHSHYIDGTCRYYCRLFCVPPQQSLVVSLATTPVPISSALMSYVSRATTSKTMVTFLTSSTLFTTLTTPTSVPWLVTTSLASVGGSTTSGFAARPP